jgi:hypothetical protein
VSRVVQTLSPAFDPLLFWDTEPDQLVFIDGIFQTRSYLESLGSGEHSFEIRRNGIKQSFSFTMPARGAYQVDIAKQQLIPLIY